MIDISTIELPPINHFISSVILLLAVISIKSAVALAIKHQPLNFFNFYCQKLAEKVNKSTNPENQQKIAGLVALVITLTPLIIILWLFEMFIEVTWLWYGLLLYIALGPFTVSRDSKLIAQALVANKNFAAKTSLQPYVLRETKALSTVGLSKACIEMQLLRTLQEIVVVSFYFLLFGPLFAVAYRLLLEMHYSWNVKKQRFFHFGQYPQLIINILQWLPVRLFILVMLLLSTKSNFLLTWRLIKGKFFVFNNNIALHCFALSLQIKLGGVAMVEGIKLRKPSFNDQARQPEITDIIHASSLLAKTLITCAVIVITLAAFTLLK